MSLPRALRHLVVLVLATLTALAASVTVAAVASAHVTVSSADAAAGGFGKLTFRVPNESDTASTVSIRIQIPEEAALASLRAQPVDVTLPLQGGSGEDGSVQISVDPARPGPNVLHVYLFDDGGSLTQPAGIEVTITEPQQQLGPIEVDLEPAGPGHYVGDGMTIPGAGTWTLAVSVRVDEFTATTARTSFPVR